MWKTCTERTIELSTQKWGNSPKGIELKRKYRAYKLEGLIDSCDLSAKEPAEIAAWKQIKPVGREVS